MKVLLSLLLCLWSSFARAQVVLPVDTDTKLISYSGVVPTDGISRAELYTRAKLWFADTFKSMNDVVQVDEKEAGIMQAKAWSAIDIHYISARNPSHLQLWYTVKLAFKEGRYKYDISSFLIKWPATVAFPSPPAATPAEQSLIPKTTRAKEPAIILFSGNGRKTLAFGRSL